MLSSLSNVKKVAFLIGKNAPRKQGQTKKTKYAISLILVNTSMTRDDVCMFVLLYSACGLRGYPGAGEF